MRKNSAPIYIESIKINNIRTFGEGNILNFQKKDGTLSQWTLILGDNSMGKSTLLQCTAWMRPFLPYDIEEMKKDKFFKPSPIINDEENDVLEKLVRKKRGSPMLGKISANFIAKKKLNTKTAYKENDICTSFMNIGVTTKGKLEIVDPSFTTKNEDIFFNDEVVMYGYSASRKLGKLNLDDLKLLDTIPNFINESTELYDAEEILQKLHYASLDAKTEKERARYKEFIERVKAMLVSILPDFEDILSIEIQAPKLFQQDEDGGLVITTKHGKKIPYSNFSLGYKTVTALGVDLAWRLFNRYREVLINPLDGPAIVLIDEIDLHLHPVWQREIISGLSVHFPNIQFVATAHSPLIVQAAIEANLAVLKFRDAGVIIENEPEGIDGWRVDQILTSELFGLYSARGLMYDSLLQHREKLLNKKRPTAKDKADLAETNNKLINYPTGENPEEIENRKFISDIVSRIKKNQTKS